jgi:hypothetical protein
MGKGCSTLLLVLKIYTSMGRLWTRPICLGVKKRKILLTNEIARNWWFELFLRSCLH